MELPRSSDHANQREADKVQFIAALGWAGPARKLIGQQGRAPNLGPRVPGRGLDGDGALATGAWAGADAVYAMQRAACEVLRKAEGR